MNMKIYVISRYGDIVETIKRKVKDGKCTYKGKKLLVKDMRGTNINGYCIYPWGYTWDYEGFRCEQCGRPMNVVDYHINPVCLKCAQENQRRMNK